MAWAPYESMVLGMEGAAVTVYIYLMLLCCIMIVILRLPSGLPRAVLSALTFLSLCACFFFLNPRNLQFSLLITTI